MVFNRFPNRVKYKLVMNFAPNSMGVTLKIAIHSTFITFVLFIIHLVSLLLG